ncbi:prepilin-type N-terminal cleavage/methylation domain-containing protein [Oscillibacter valericigenes]|uniref:type IV pilus modification PilV family protein n=1 Tax=Oscillibacter valericigenes TaxID=351091 RepID=UPI001F24AFFE|nr:prepilin-type N-terminal cleavage/methylation domain-containing protein [Oscillibacter valericigenes]MCF2615673.1 prepilin-type N-terminal cleavage/methylation domain-containing protein [Oscillibacter valericigenes]
MMHKLRSRRGMTLSEVLVALLILSLVTVGVAAGVGASVRVYRQATEASDAHMLASTLSTALMDELRYARDIQADGSFTSDTFGEGSLVGVTDGRITVGGEKLLSDAAYAGLQVRNLVKETETLDLVKPVKVNNDTVFQVAFEICNSAGTGVQQVEFSVSPLNDPVGA